MPHQILSLKRMYMGSLAMVFTNAVLTLQPMRPLGLSTDRLKTSVKNATYKANILKIGSKVRDLSATIAAMATHCFGALSQVRAIGHSSDCVGSMV